MTLVKMIKVINKTGALLLKKVVYIYNDNNFLIYGRKKKHIQIIPFLFEQK